MQLPRERQEEIYKKEWLPLQDKFKANMAPKEYAGELTTAFWFYLRKDGTSVGEKEVYKEIKNVFDREKNDSEVKLKELVQFANYYQCLKFDNNEREESLQRWFERLLRLDFTTCHIFLLNVYHRYEQKELSLENFEKILRYLESYFVRRWFAKVPTRSLGNVFNNLYREVKAANPDDLVEGLRKVLGRYEKTKIWPSDEEFRKGILNTPVYAPRGSNDRVKLILESLTDSLSKEQVNKQNLTIEHIMPQNLKNSQWPSMLGANSAEVHKQFLHTLGNLTLTGYNTEIGNKPFDEKKSIYLESNVSLNKYFQEITIWNAQAIKERAQKLADIAIQVWPR
ncbi:HNH endonuclease family protein [Microcoleus sp. D3_18_C4]